MRKLLLIFSLLAALTVSLAWNVDKVYVGIKYSFRNFRNNGKVFLVDPFSRKLTIYDIENRRVDFSIEQFGSFVIAVFSTSNGYLIVDRTSPSVLKFDPDWRQIKKVPLTRRVQGSVFSNGNLYLLLEGGTLCVFDQDLNQLSAHNFTGSPAYLFVWKELPFVTYLWNDNADIQFLGDEPKDFGLTTPAIFEGSYLVDTRGGQLLNMETGKVIKLKPYISSVTFDGKTYYAASQSASTIFVINEDKIVQSIQVPYTPTAVKRIQDKLVILSAPYNKVMVIRDGGSLEVLETGEYPLDVFEIANGFAVYCSDSGEMWYYTTE
uniref:WD40 repeat domain-containing protein n=1 Tax=Fervidobacterium thailandense TaxID=1008305 RepID=A0A7C4GF20_9BACT